MITVSPSCRILFIHIIASTRFTLLNWSLGSQAFGHQQRWQLTIHFMSISVAVANDASHHSTA